MWNEANVGLTRVDFEPGFTGAMVNGSLVELESGENFINAVMGLARDASLGKFRVFLGGDEIDADSPECPEFIEDGMQLKIVPYDEAGGLALV